METTKFTRKPFDVEGVQVTDDNIDEVAKWCQGEVNTQDDGNKYIKVRVLRVLNERQTQAFVSDWVLYAGTGYKVYTDKAFRKSFDQVRPKIENDEELRTVTPTIAVG